jgi:hypothetical protein
MGALDVVRPEVAVRGSVLLTQRSGGRCARVHGFNPPSGRRLDMATARGRCDLVQPRCSCTNLRRWRPIAWLRPWFPSSHTSPSPRWSLPLLLPSAQLPTRCELLRTVARRPAAPRLFCRGAHMQRCSVSAALSTSHVVDMPFVHRRRSCVIGWVRAPVALSIPGSRNRLQQLRLWLVESPASLACLGGAVRCSVFWLNGHHI